MIARTESAHWLNVLYIGTTGKEILGWIEASMLTPPNIAGQQVELLDLEVSEFQFNTKQEVVDFREAISKLMLQYYKTDPYSIMGFISFALFFMALILSFIFSSLTLGMVLIGAAVLIFVVYTYLHTKHRNVLAHEFTNYMITNLGEVWVESESSLTAFPKNTPWWKRLEAIRISKQSDLENQMEFQAKQSAMNAAVHLGGIVLNRAITNRQSIEVRHR
ncbi:hypothetical protein [Candidatus Viridilinea mediisalina]|uniref:Uncharacterized protein n=1 Tax=Candidatus Viridilinea mediisalina TaxID=2024553 RepID=A0A2A6RQ91_9CHLR|nr:hypothetical protein [Candidatus Viridilinea mediisalina]PDW05060.1 hypothetical protein CJ255_00265 [Candidatus Viridilinea mediisalina]